MKPQLLLMLVIGCGGRHDGASAPAAPATPEAPATPATPTVNPTTATPGLPKASSRATPPSVVLIPPRDKSAKAGCAGLSGDLQGATRGDTAGLRVDDAGRVQVTVETSGDVSWPDSFVEDKAIMGLVQGWSPPLDLCDLATSPGVVRVRSPHRATPK